MRFIFWILFFFSPTVFSEISAFDDYINNEAKNEFSIAAHKPTYILPFNYNDRIQNYLVYEDENGDSPAERIEIKYQISFKVPVFKDLANLPLSGYLAYTQVSYWQAYNRDFSSPFRETNYEPEFFVTLQPQTQFGLIGSDWKFKLFSLGVAHQSNGLSEPDSRSWNRLNANLVFENKNFYIAANPWHRFEEKDEDDNNPDILDYYGHGEITLAYANNDNLISITSRNNIESHFSKGSVSATWSFPLFGRFKGYIRAFTGYGNSLIEYDVYTTTFGVGLTVTDFL
jgi:phospholipase A1